MASYVISGQAAFPYHLHYILRGKQLKLYFVPQQSHQPRQRETRCGGGGGGG